MIAQRPYTAQCCHKDMKILSDGVERFIPRHFQCFDCAKRCLVRIDGPQPYADIMCMECSSKIEVKSIRCLGKWGPKFNAGMLSKEFCVKLGSRTAFEKLKERLTFPHILIVWYSYEVDPGFNILDDFHIEGAKNQKFEYGLLLRRETICNIFTNPDVDYGVSFENVDKKVMLRIKNLTHFEVLNISRATRKQSRYQEEIQKRIDEAILFKEAMTEFMRQDRKRKKRNNKILFKAEKKKMRNAGAVMVF